MADFDGTTGNDTYTGTGADEAILDGGGGADSLNGAGGDDTITVTGGSDTIDGGAGRDRLVVDFDNRIYSVTLSGSLEDGYSGQIDGYSTNDPIFSGIEDFTVTVTSDYAAVTTGDGDDAITGGYGNDILRSGLGADTIDGGAGNDSWGGDRSAETASLSIDLRAVSSLPGGGSITNIEGFNTLLTGAGDDTLTGTAIGAFDESISSGGGDDVVSLFGNGFDTVDGGAGRDRLVIHFGSGIRVYDTNISGSLGDGYSGQFDGVGDNNLNFSGIEDFTVTVVSSDYFHVTTGDGDDSLTGGTGNDLLHAGGGSDTVDGGTGGNDNLDGGDGVDTLSYASAEAGVTVSLKLTGAQATGGAGSDTATGFEHLIGSDFKDKLTGNTGANRIEGGGGDDAVKGAAGADSLFGGNGVDRMVGGAANDVLDGGAGDDKLFGDFGKDTLIGGSGRDVMEGGANADAFVFTELADSLTNAPDLITDLEATDVIDLSAIDAKANLDGDQAFKLVDHFSGKPGEATLVYNPAQDRTLLRLDVDGDKSPDMIIAMAGDQTAFDNFVL